jgi:hypothetical protein
MACSAYGDTRNSSKILAGKPEWKRPLGRPGRRREDIKMGLREIWFGIWIGFLWLRIGTGDGFL